MHSLLELLSYSLAVYYGNKGKGVGTALTV